MEKFDVVVVGAGSGGLTASISLSQAGKKVALIEKGHFGGDCTNYGCVPSKALIHASIHSAGKGVKNALQEVKDKRNHFLEHENAHDLSEKFGMTVYEGFAELKDKNHMKIIKGDEIEVIEFQKAVLALGSRPRTININGVPEDKILTNESVFELETLKSLVVVGGGYIACELGEAFARLGVTVTMLVRGDSLIQTEEPEAISVIEQTLIDAGVDIRYGIEITSGTDDVLALSDGSSVSYEYILLSIGRISNTSAGLQNSKKIVVNTNGIVVDDYNRTGEKSIFAIGDCVADNPKFTHWADHEARGVFRNILFPYRKTSVRSQTLPTTMYTSTELARVGMTKHELIDEGLDDDIMTIKHDFESDDRSYLNDAIKGFIMIHFMRVSGKVLGGTILGDRAGTLLPQITMAMDNGLSARKLMRTIHAYPTRGRLLKKTWEWFALETAKNWKSEAKYWLSTNSFKIIAGVIWIAAIIAYFWIKNSYGLTNDDITQGIYDFLLGSLWGPVILIVIYGLRGIILFPAGIMTLLAGVLFGPLRGSLYAFLGAITSANVSYFIGKKFGKGMISPGNNGIISTIKKRLTGSDYISVLLLRLIPLNFDIVNYAIGIFNIKRIPYIVATALGILPGMITYVLLGASLDIQNGIALDQISLNTTYLTYSVILYIVSFGIAYILKSKFQKNI